MSLSTLFSGMLGNAVGNNQTNNPADIRTTKENLQKAGYFPADEKEDTENPFLTRKMDDGIKKFQTDNHLKIDGVMKPGGETERSMFEALTNRNADEAFDAVDMGADAGRIGFGGNVSGTFVPVPKKKPHHTKIDTPPIPERKPDILAEKIKIPQHAPDPVFDQFREKLAPREGGIANRSKQADPGGLTNKGMSQNFLNDLRARSPEWNLPEKSTDLTDEQITDIFRDEFYERPQINKLHEVGRRR
ncbi:MAG: glycosyl hydrolase 108 family protein [Alphaproteobacteria bacterium]